jgi:PAS domain S-box-containing protein
VAAVLSVLLDAAPVGFAYYDRERRYVHINQSLAAANGATPAEHIGRTIAEMVPEVAPHAEPLIDRVLATGEAVLNLEMEGRAEADGSPTFWRTGWYPVRSTTDGSCTGVAVVATDISDVVAAGAALQRTALTLQRSLLPAQVPSTEELEVAARYSAGAADTVVGGDWYDVIAMGGGRLAVVIGDVMGRGVPAAAVMGQLRTAARTCAKLDLRPADVADVLDGLLVDLDQDSIATCIYGAFDPHTRELRVASAGHPPPVLRSPDGSVRTLDLDVSAPLGIGDAKREVSVQLPPGSVLALYTDGLIEARGSDLGAGIAALCRTVAEGPQGLEELADAVMATVSGSLDDVALLLLRVPEDVDARSRTVSVPVPLEHAELSSVRHALEATLRAWHVPEDLVDTGTLLASELATNALVHGIGGVELRLRLSRSSLLLESVDGGRHMPRRRRTDQDDEHGRGLQLVAALAHRWGFRPSDDGKVVWVEFDLSAGEEPSPEPQSPEHQSPEQQSPEQQSLEQQSPEPQSP